MSRADANPTRDRIVEAARAEFAQRGLAGARVDRIATAASTSKERVYAYFRSKEALYVHVASRELAAAIEAVEVDPRDLSSLAGQLFDYVQADPDRYRFAVWSRLERALELGQDSTVPFRAAMSRHVDAVRRAQESGVLDASWEPAQVLALVAQLATTWSDQIEWLTLCDDPNDLASQRAAIVRTVAVLFPPAAS